MRLIRLTIPSWKNLKDLTIEFDQESFTTVIVGRNGTGKSISSKRSLLWLFCKACG